MNQHVVSVDKLIQELVLQLPQFNKGKTFLGTFVTFQEQRVIVSERWTVSMPDPKTWTEISSSRTRHYQEVTAMHYSA